MTIRLTRPVALEARAAVFVTPRTARRAVISRHRRHRGAHRRRQQDQDVLAPLWPGCRLGGCPSPAVGALYRALHHGPEGTAEPGAPGAGGEANPLLFVSRAPWGIYDVLTAFFETLGIPGPLLFLREWGIRLSKSPARRAEDHKRVLISSTCWR